MSTQTTSISFFIPLKIAITGLWGMAEYLRTSNNIWLAATMDIAVWLVIGFMLVVGFIVTYVTYGATVDNIYDRSIASRAFIKKYTLDGHIFYASSVRNAIRTILFLMTLVMFPLFILHEHWMSMIFTGFAFAMIQTGLIKMINIYEKIVDLYNESEL